MELLHNYYIEPIDTTQTAQEVNETNTVIKPVEKDKTKYSNTNHIYQNIQKNNPEKKFGQYHFSWKVQKTKNFNHQILKLIF